MLECKDKKRGRLLWVVFLLCMLIVLGVFFERVLSNSMITEMSGGQVIKISKQYVMGCIYDRYGNEIVKGTQSGVEWENEITQAAFDNLMGVDIESSKNSRMTVCGNCSWIYGTEDNCFETEDFLGLNKERIGGSVELTLDKELQVYIYKLLAERGYKEASVVVSDWSTGEVYAAIGSVFSETYHPGSTIKPILAAAILNIRPDLAIYTYNCTDSNHNFYTEDGVYRVNCINNKCHGVMNMEDAMIYSCNGYFVSLLQQVSKQALQEELKKWGFDSVVSYEQFMYWDHSFVKESSSEQDYLLAAIGQANVFITPMGMNLATNTILNGGCLKEPVLIKEKQSSHNEVWREVQLDKVYEVCDDESATMISNMMLGVTEKGTGKSYYYPGFASKTGTAQKANPDGSLSDKQTVWTTGGLVGADKHYSITVCLDNVSGETGSKEAGKIAKNILEFMEGGKSNE